MTTTTTASHRLRLTAVAGVAMAAVAIVLTMSGVFGRAQTQRAAAPGADEVLAVPGGIAGGDIPATMPTLAFDIRGFGSFTLPTELGVDLVGGATRTPLLIRLPDGRLLSLPYEMGVDVAGGDTGVWMPHQIEIPGFGSFALPYDMGVDVAGGSTGLEVIEGR